MSRGVALVCSPGRKPRLRSALLIAPASRPGLHTIAPPGLHSENALNRGAALVGPGVPIGDIGMPPPPGRGYKNDRPTGVGLEIVLSRGAALVGSPGWKPGAVMGRDVISATCPKSGPSCPRCPRPGVCHPMKRRAR